MLFSMRARAGSYCTESRVLNLRHACAAIFVRT